MSNRAHYEIRHAVPGKYFFTTFNRLIIEVEEEWAWVYKNDRPLSLEEVQKERSQILNYVQPDFCEPSLQSLQSFI